MHRFFFAFILLFVATATTMAQSPKREFRGAWIATVANIDWPSKPGLLSGEQQEEFKARLDQLQALGCNAVIVQVRPASDVFYESDTEPWSHYLTGKSGTPPFPFYDPLTYMVAEAHKRNMEFHAWFNPFRALVDSRNNLHPAGHVTHTHPSWIIKYGGKSYVNPGLPEAREYVSDIITDVVKRYDIDAVHLDDYFYPYRIPKQQFGDGVAFLKYGDGMNREDWRRNNVSVFIAGLNQKIKAVKPYMKLGISPFGIWRNKTKDPDGSETRGGQTNYDDLYADVLMWMQKGWIDYLMPQLYWEHAHKAAPFDVLLPWWYGHCYERHVYYGLGLYRMAEAKSGPWTTPKELLWQLRDIRGQCPNSGYAFYSASCFNKIKAPLKDSLKNSYNKYPALIPPMEWLDSIPPVAPVLTLSTTVAKTLLTWHSENRRQEPLRYVVYRFVDHEPVDLERNDKILAVQQDTILTDITARQYKHCTYIVTALDRMWNESRASNQVATGQ